MMEAHDDYFCALRHSDRSAASCANMLQAWSLEDSDSCYYCPNTNASRVVVSTAVDIGAPPLDTHSLHLVIVHDGDGNVWQ